MKLGDYLESWGRTLFEAPLAGAPKPEEPPELAEIRLAILDEVRAKSYRAGGRKVFPFDMVRVDLRGVERERYGVYTGRFFRQYLEREIRAGLTAAGCRFPETLHLEVRATLGLPQPGEPWLVVESVGGADAGGGGRSPARLVVREGTANLAEVPLEKARTNIGRAVGRCTAPRGYSAATTWPSPKTPRSTAPSPANTPTSSTTAPPASTAFLTTAGTRAARPAKAPAAPGSYAAA